MQLLIQDNVAKIRALCEKHHVRELHVFGSAVRDDFNESSDVDFLIEYKNIDDVTVSVDNMDALNEALRSLLHRDIDLIQYRLLTNKYLKHFINQEKILLYAET